MTKPKRIQMHRRKGGWRKDNPDAVIVSRPGKWGNPFKIGERDHENDIIQDRADAKQAFKAWADDCLDPRSGNSLFSDLHELRGKDLACWCPLDGPCHADVLLELANGKTRP